MVISSPIKTTNPCMGNQQFDIYLTQSLINSQFKVSFFFRFFVVVVFFSE
jgi:hypothetical protein